MKWIFKGLLAVASLSLIIGGFTMSSGEPKGLNQHPLMPLKIFLIFLGFVLLIVFILLMVWPIIKRKSVEQIKNQERKNNPNIDSMSDDEIIEKYGDVGDEEDSDAELSEDDMDEDFLDDEEMEEEFEDDEDEMEEEFEDVEEDLEEIEESEEGTDNEVQEVVNKNICEYCGTENKDNAKFCSSCGAKLK